MVLAVAGIAALVGADVGPILASVTSRITHAGDRDARVAVSPMPGDVATPTPKRASIAARVPAGTLAMVPERAPIAPFADMPFAVPALDESAGGSEGGGSQRHRISDDLLGRLIGTCAPQVDPKTQAAIVSVESGGDAWAVHDDNDDSRYAPDSFADAVAIGRVLIARDRQTYAAADRGVDVGLAQINSANFASLGVDVAAMFHPCANLRASARIIVSAFARERAALRGMSPQDADQVALRRALQVYNSGKGSGDEPYVSAILAALDTPFVQKIAATATLTSEVGANVAADAGDDRSRALATEAGVPASSRDPAGTDEGRASDLSRRDRAPTASIRSAVFVHVDPNAIAPQSPAPEGRAAQASAPTGVAPGSGDRATSGSVPTTPVDRDGSFVHDAHPDTPGASAAEDHGFVKDPR